MVAVVTRQRDTKWFDRLTVAQRELDREKIKWRRNRALLLGLSPAGVTDWSEVNIAWAAFETLVGVCYHQVADGIVRETKATSANVAKLLTNVSRDDFEQMRLRYFVRMAILDVFWAGRGIILEKMLGDPTLVTSRFGTDEYKTPTLENQCYVLTRPHPASMLSDPMATMPDLSDAAWLSFDVYPTIKELKDKFNISQKVLDKLPKLHQNPNRDSPLDYPRPTMVGGEAEEDDEFTQVCCREVWDRQGRERLIMPKYADTVLENVKWPVELRYNKQLRFPASFLYFNEHMDGSFPIAEITTAARQLEQFAILFRQILRDAVTKWRKIAYRADMFDAPMINKIVNEPGTSLIPMRSNSVGDPTKLDLGKSALYVLQDPAVKQDQVAVLNMVKGLIHEIFGAGDFASAGFRTTRSATEAAQLSDFLKVRMTSRTENIDAFHREILVNHVLYLQETMTEERVARIADPGQVEVWQQYKREDIQGEFRFQVIAGSSQPRNTESHRQEVIAFYRESVNAVMQAGGNLAPLFDFAAPFFHMPDYLVQMVFNGHKGALMELAKMFQAAHMGMKPDPSAYNEAIAKAVNTGITPADMQLIQNSVNEMAKQQGASGQNPAQQMVGQPDAS